MGIDEWRAPTTALGNFASDSVVIAGLFQTVGTQPEHVILGLVGKRDPAEPHHGWEIGLDQEGRLIAMVQGEAGGWWPSPRPCARPRAARTWTCRS